MAKSLYPSISGACGVGGRMALMAAVLLSFLTLNWYRGVQEYPVKIIFSYEHLSM